MKPESTASCPACGRPRTGPYCAGCGTLLDPGQRPWKPRRLAAAGVVLLLALLPVLVLRERSSAEPAVPDSAPMVIPKADQQRFENVHTRMVQLQAAGDTAAARALADSLRSARKAPERTP